MATKLIRLGQQFCTNSVYQRLPRVLPVKTFISPKFGQFTDGSLVRSLSLSSSLREEEEENTKQHRFINPAGDRRVEVPVETSIRYLQSKAYKEAYGDKPVWYYYRRNYKGHEAPRTRRSCIKRGYIWTGSPCPICRDEYLVLHYTNTALLKQFISEYSGEVLDWRVTGLCQRRITELLVAIEKAKDYGTISFDLPFRSYDYKDYIPKDLNFH